MASKPTASGPTLPGILYYDPNTTTAKLATAGLRLAPGMLMLFALRAALIGLDWRWIAVPLIVSLPVHLADLARTARG